MRFLKSSLSYGVLLLACILVLCLSSTFAQDKAGVPKSSGVSSAKKSPDEKATTPRADAPEAGEQATAGESWDDEATDQIRKRENGFTSSAAPRTATSREAREIKLSNTCSA